MTQDGYKPAYKPINYDEDDYDKKPLYEVSLISFWKKINIFDDATIYGV